MNTDSKNHLFSKIYYIVFFSALCLGLLKVYDKMIDGFYLSRIYGFLPYTPSFEIKHSTSTLDESLQALNQPFSYLSSGSQCFVFISQDKRYILKFFKNYRWKSPYLLKILPNLLSIKNFKDNITQKKQVGVLKTYESARLAFTQLKEQSGLIYLQLNTPSPIQKNVTLYNKLKKKYSVDLSQVPFALQKYAKPFDKVLLTCKKEHDLDKAQEYITQLISYILERRELGITDSDPHFVNNFGFLSGAPICLDIGGLLIDSKKDKNYFYTKELTKIKAKALPWIHKNYPELEPFMLNTLQKIQNDYFN